MGGEPLILFVQPLTVLKRLLPACQAPQVGVLTAANCGADVSNLLVLLCLSNNLESVFTKIKLCGVDALPIIVNLR